MAIRPLLEEGRFCGRPADLVHEPSGFRVWMIEPLGILTQVGEASRADESVAEFLARTVHDELESRRQRGEKSLYLHDWRRLGGYTPQARKIMTDWAMEVRQRAERIVIALSPQTKVVRMGVSVATMALQVAGFTVELVDELEPVLSELGAQPSP